MYPSSSMRHSAIVFVNASCRSLGFPDSFVFLLPHLRPYLRFEPSTSHLTVRNKVVLLLFQIGFSFSPRVLLPISQTKDGLERCLIAPWTRSKLDEELARVAERSRDTQLGTQWTSVNDNLVEVQETKTDPSPSLLTSGLGVDQTTGAASQHGVLNDCMIEYLTMLQRSRGANASGMEHQSASGPAMAIEGSLKLAQHVRFPTQRVAGTLGMSIPPWYASLRDAVDKENQNASETSAIRSVSSLSQGKSLCVACDRISS